MNAPIDTLAFAQSLEEAGFGHEQARALAAAFGKTYQASTEDAVTRHVLKAELADLRHEVKADLVDLRHEVKDDLANLRLELVREIALVGKDVSGRLWSTVTIIAGVSTAISAVVGAAVALLIHAKAF